MEARLPLDLAALQDGWQRGTTETTETTVTGFGGGRKRNLEARLPLDLAALQDGWQGETTETTETTVTGLGMCDVSVVLVVSVVSFWHWIRSVECQSSEPRAAAIGTGCGSVECQLSEPGAAVIGAGYEVLSVRRVNLDQQN